MTYWNEWPRTCVRSLGLAGFFVMGLAVPHTQAQEWCVPPDPDYCVTRSCGIGDGDCDPGQCDEGVCVNDVGAQYGLPAYYDVCEAQQSGRPDPDYCVTRSCGVGEGDCDPGQCGAGLVCVNDVGAEYGLPADYDVCEAQQSGRPDPDYCVTRSCGVGEGDCDPGQCGAGLVCVNDVGAEYGLPAHYDVCEERDTTPPPAAHGIRQLLGTWRFTNSRTTQTYRFGECPINTVVKPCVADPSQRTYLWPTVLFEGLNSLGHSYYLADVERGVCRVYLLYEPNGSRVDGHYGEAYGNCLSRSALEEVVEDLTYQRYPTTGTRISPSTAQALSLTPEDREQIERAIEESLFLLME